MPNKKFIRKSPLTTQHRLAAGSKAPHVKEKETYFPDSIEIGQVILTQIATHNELKIRPFYVWGIYHNENMKIIGVDVMGMTSQKTESDIYSSNFFTKQGYLTSGTCQRDFDKDIILYTNSLTAINSDHAPYLFKDQKIDTKLFPDIILRRAEALYHSPSVQFNAASRKFGEDYFQAAMRRGFLFTGISTKDMVSSGVFAPDVKGAMEIQGPFKIPGFLEQKDIDRIAAIAKNYAGYCHVKKFPIIWPEPGRYPHWPDEFLAFSEYREHESIKIPPWFGKDKPRYIPCPASSNNNASIPQTPVV